jgi:glycogen debranching enzyme
VVHADGTLAEGPIALVEAQGYVYLAKTRIAEVYEALGEPDRARSIRDQAESLRRQFDEAFWDPEEGTYALALDGRKHQVRSVTSNPGHCLFCEIVPESRAASIAKRLMASDMYSGWGVRTLSADSAAYNPMSYHNGSVWPHDNAIVAAGLRRYGFEGAAEQIATALFEVASRSSDHRLPELYCGFDRDGHDFAVSYPAACIPQAWAAAVPYMLLTTLLGISARAPEGVLVVERPLLPDWLGVTELEGIRVGDSVVNLGFERKGEATGVSLRAQRGSIKVVMGG